MLQNPDPGIHFERILFFVPHCPPLAAGMLPVTADRQPDPAGKKPPGESARFCARFRAGIRQQAGSTGRIAAADAVGLGTA